MTKKLMLVSLGIALLALRVLAAESGMEMYQKAATLEKSGKLGEALKLYEQVAIQFPKDKTLAANALMRAADGHRTLGDQKALILYQRVVREYPDQVDAVKKAQSMIARLRTPPAPEVKVELKPLGESVYWLVQSDGQHALYFDERRSKLMYGDLDGKNARRVFDVGPQVPEVTASFDLSTVVLHFVGAADLPDHWAVIKNDGTGYRELPPLPESGPFIGVSFSWDNRYIVMGASLTKVRLSDGNVQALLSKPVVGMNNAAFSPDGRFVAYSTQTRESPAKTYTVPTSGGEPTLVTNSRMLMDWTPDGDILAVSVFADGSFQSFLVRMSDGKPVGPQIQLQSSQGGPPAYVMSGRAFMARDGSLIARVAGATAVTTVYAERRAEGGYGPWKQMQAIDDVESYPTLSSSGKRLVYISRKPNGDVVRVRDIDSGEEQAVHQGAANIVRVCSFGAVETVVYCTERDAVHQTTIIVKVPLNGGKAERLFTVDGVQILSGMTPDGRTVVLSRRDAPTSTLWELGADKEQVLRGKGQASPNARWAFSENNEPLRHRLEVRPLSEPDNWTTVTLNSRSNAGAQARYSRDGEWLVYRDSKVLQTNDELGAYVRRLAGGPPERVGDYPGPLVSQMFFSASDGANRVLMQYTGPFRTREVTIVRNLLPTTKR